MTSVRSGVLCLLFFLSVGWKIVWFEPIHAGVVYSVTVSVMSIHIMSLHVSVLFCLEDTLSLDLLTPLSLTIFPSLLFHRSLSLVERSLIMIFHLKLKTSKFLILWALFSGVSLCNYCILQEEASLVRVEQCSYIRMQQHIIRSHFIATFL